MTQNLKIQIIDAATKESEVRPFSEEEMSSYEEIISTSSSLESLVLAKEQARTSALAKLAALGLTEEEIAAL
jgi:hypothetical protein